MRRRDRRRAPCVPACGDLVLRTLVRFIALDAVPVEGGRRVALSYLEVTTLAGRARTDDRRADAERRIERPGVDADGRVRRDGRLLVGAVRGARHAGPCVVGDAVTRHVLVRAGHAVAGVCAEDDARVHLLELVEAEAAPARTGPMPSVPVAPGTRSGSGHPVLRLGSRRCSSARVRDNGAADASMSESHLPEVAPPGPRP